MICWLGPDYVNTEARRRAIMEIAIPDLHDPIRLQQQQRHRDGGRYLSLAGVGIVIWFVF